MDGGNLCDALVDFTSGLSEMVDLKNGGYKVDEEKRNLLRKQMLRKHDEHALMCCAIAVHTSNVDYLARPLSLISVTYLGDGLFTI